MTPAELADIIRDHTARAIPLVLEDMRQKQVALELRLMELETRPAPAPVVGPVGPAGAKGDTGAGIASVVVTADGRWLAHLTDGRSLDAGPVPKGEKGDVGPRGEKGEPGAPGETGLPGRAGRDGFDGAAGAAGERGPQGEKGLDGLHGRDGRDGAPGLPGATGEKGLDGRDGVNGINGKDGLDGLGFDDADLVLDETRGWLFLLKNGERVREFCIPLPFFRGNWEAGNTYPKGAGVRWDGHYWWALKETHQQPGEGSTDWQIVVSRGKQGREGKQGKDGSPGRDLTSIDPATGRKW